MRKLVIALGILSLAVLCYPNPALAHDDTTLTKVDLNFGVGVGHGLNGNAKGNTFGTIWGGPVVKNWNDGATKLSTVVRFEQLDATEKITGIGAKAILSDVVYGDPKKKHLSLLVDVGALDEFAVQGDGATGTALTVGGGLLWQIGKVVNINGYLEGKNTNRQWEYAAYFTIGVGKTLRLQ